MGIWEVVDEVGTYCPAFKPWELLLCYAHIAMLVDVDWFERIHDRCESYYLMVNLRWLL